ncbi:hypothetical protein F2Q69_00006329 [Brassica cretica]|uniref:Uncharacterized protein n=1 Tax=Brassica cretica TaxID=69181 RepID=A0A8S9NSW0_BRACR|nr:hypothetical protein F2Q69_00006329 [Brassica cretica]
MVVRECRSAKLVFGSTVVDENQATNKCFYRSMRSIFLSGLNVPSLQDLMRIAVELPCCFWRNIKCILSKISQPQPPGGKKQRILIRSKVHTARNASSREDNTLLTAVARFNARIIYESLLVPADSRSQPGITLLQSLVPAGLDLNCKAGPCNLWI